MTPDQYFDFRDSVVAAIKTGFADIVDVISYGMPGDEDVTETLERGLRVGFERIDDSVSYRLGELVSTVEREARRVR